MKAKTAVSSAMDAPHEAAEALFVSIWNRLTADWGQVKTFRQMGVLGEDAARAAMQSNNEFFIRQQLSHGEHRSLLKDPEEFIRSALAEEMPTRMTDTAVATFRRTLFESVLVFSHSILDAAVLDCVRICALMAPDDWTGFASGKKYSLEQVKEAGYAGLQRAAVEAELIRLERESLIVKAERVFQVCRPKKQEYLTNGFRFDKAHLVALDELRHRIVHAPGVEWPMDTAYEDIDFLQRTGLHLFCMVGETFELKFSGRQAFDALTARNNRQSRP